MEVIEKEHERIMHQKELERIRDLKIEKLVNIFSQLNKMTINPAFTSCSKKLRTCRPWVFQDFPRFPL